jgi:hypothetical protein
MWRWIVKNLFVIKSNRCTNFKIYFVMKFYMFRTVRLSIIRSLFTVHSAMVYVIQVCRHIPLLSVQWINSWWWTDEFSETCRISWQNKFVKLVHLFCFTTKKFVTMHGHINVKLIYVFQITEFYPILIIDKPNFIKCIKSLG